MLDNVDMIVTAFIKLIPALVGIRLVFDYTRIILFKD